MSEGGKSAENPVWVRAKRESKETNIELELALEPGDIEIDSGIGFFDHMLKALAYHAGWALKLRCRGDLEVDDHHAIEDCGIVLGGAFRQALQGMPAIQRFGSAFAPLDEALARAVVDISARPWASVDLGLVREKIGDAASENLRHFLETFASNARITLHVDVLKGSNDHHRAEAAFKALALALKMALQPRFQPLLQLQQQLQQQLLPGQASAAANAPSTKGSPILVIETVGGPAGPQGA